MKKNKDLQQYTSKLAQNQVKKTPTVTENDLFSANYGEHPSFDEFKTYCKQHLRLSPRKHKEYIIALWNDMQDCRWLKKNGKPAKSWQSLVNAHNGILIGKYNIQRTERRSSETHMPFYNIETSDEEYPENGKHYICYTDGSCDNLRSRAGGSAYIIIKDGEITKMKCRGMLNTTNNRMELLAIISAVNSCPEGSCIDVYTDSKHSIWFLTQEHMPKINGDLYELYKKCSAPVEGVRFHWVKGHDGNRYNEMADDMAYGAYCSICDEYNIEKARRK